MLNTSDPSETFRRLLAQREVFYSEADLTVHLENRRRNKVVQTILDKADAIVRVLNGR